MATRLTSAESPDKRERPSEIIRTRHGLVALVYRDAETRARRIAELEARRRSWPTDDDRSMMRRQAAHRSYRRGSSVA